MADAALANTGAAPTRPSGWRGIAADWSSDQRAFKNVSWGKAMMWIFLLSDTFIFSCFLLSYMTVRISTTVPWPNPSEVFALTIGGTTIPLILIAIMTFILISSSGTMAMAVNFGYRHDHVKSAVLMLVTAAFGATFVGMQGFEWTTLIMEGMRPWGQPVGRGPVWLQLFHDHGLPRHPCDDRSHLPDHHCAKSVAWRLRPRSARLFHQPQGALRDRRNHGPVLALRRSGVGVHLCPFLSLVRRPWHRQSRHRQSHTSKDNNI